VEFYVEFKSEDTWRSVKLEYIYWLLEHPHRKDDGVVY